MKFGLPPPQGCLGAARVPLAAVCGAATAPNKVPAALASRAQRQPARKKGGP
jgi:hypothetical protein